MKLRNKILLLIIVLLAICTGINIKKNSHFTKITLALDWTPNTNHTGIYVAQNKGYYKKLGIDLNIVQTSKMSTEGLVANNQADFGISFMPNVSMNNANNDMDLLSVLALVNNDQSGFAAKKSKNIQRPRDMENKTYCGSGSAIEEAMISTMVKNDGANPELIKYQTSDVSFINAPDECDFMWIYQGWEGVKAKQLNMKFNLIKFNDYLPKQYSPLLITSKKFSEKHPDLVQDFVNATIEGYKYAIKHPQESSEILIKENPELKNDEQLVKESQTELSSYYQGKEPYGYQDPKVWQAYLKWLNENQIIKGIKTENYTNKYLKQK